ncbi:ras association domain-containing protein 8 [Thalassophryne amazonica]|uniref:ras association domain-containing protein 8 n=1 Tax=Thalassophryne amazonica TaxID=390379 RepID=UPI001470C358|nr:ras association domain-containing protein 8 [Thalassophryne amazonica]XP_034029233.1 ras association domain-containing protein 8 [Thalassophryne amazonica]
MEVKVFVDDVQRVVCGVTEETTCEEVVITLAQALSQTGCYTLREKFKDFERSMTPTEHLLESLRKYGEQAREVQLILLHSGPSPRDGMSRTKLSRYPPCPPIRRRDAGVKTRWRSGSLSLHRQSLPPLSCSQQEAEQPPADQKRAKRKSLSLVEEARGWLESLGKGKVYNAVCDTESSKKSNKSQQTSVEISVGKVKSVRSSLLSKVRGQKSLKSDMDHHSSCCMGSQVREKEHKYLKKTQEVKPDCLSECAIIREEKNRLRETIKLQCAHLQDLQLHMRHLDKQIIELEEQQRTKKDEQEAQKKVIEEELEQIAFWENELKAEEGHEKDLQREFLEMRAKVIECKAKLEEYKDATHGLSLSVQNSTQKDSETSSKGGETAATEIIAEDQQQQKDEQKPTPETNTNRKFLDPPQALVPPNQIKERRPTGPTELREWWTRWSETQNPKGREAKTKSVHRSELTIYLGNAKV